MHINLEKFSINQCAYLLFNNSVMLNSASAEKRYMQKLNFLKYSHVVNIKISSDSQNSNSRKTKYIFHFIT